MYDPFFTAQLVNRMKENASMQMILHYGLILVVMAVLSLLLLLYIEFTIHGIYNALFCTVLSLCSAYSIPYASVYCLIFLNFAILWMI